MENLDVSQSEMTAIKTSLFALANSKKNIMLNEHQN